jgi:GTP-binding protein EngB required for normal cell division
MRIQDIVIGESYRFKDHPNYGYAKVLEILKPKQGVNKNTYSVVKCEHTIRKDDTMGFIRYFDPRTLIKDV